MSKVLITGAAGFIGSHLADRLVKDGHHVVGVDNLFRGKMKNVERLNKNPNFEFHRVDITSGRFLKKILRDVEVVYHYAAINGTKHFYERPLEVLKTNVEGTINVLKMSAECGVNKFIFASSSEVYSDPLKFPTSESHPLLIPDVDNPRYSYNASKATGEVYTRWYAKEHNFEYLILRIFNTYGPRMDTSGYGQVVPEFIRKLSEPQFTIIGDGKQTRSFCYIDDLIEMTVRAAKKVKNDILNIGNDEEIEILKLARILHELAGKKFRYKLLPPRAGDPRRRVPDITKAKKLLRYAPETDIRTGLERTLEWYG